MPSKIPEFTAAEHAVLQSLAEKHGLQITVVIDVYGALQDTFRRYGRSPEGFGIGQRALNRVADTHKIPRRVMQALIVDFGEMPAPTRMQ